MMKYYNFKGENISLLGFGMMRLPMLEEKLIDQARVNEMVKYAIEKGVNYFDTAYVYLDGNSETSLGIALEPFERSSYYLADKMSLWKITSKEDMEREFELQLKKLQTDYIDFYLIHCMTELTYDIGKKHDVFSFVKEKQKSGKIKHIGFSIHADHELMLKVLGELDFDFAQVQLNYVDLDDLPGLKGYLELRKRNIPVIIMEPLKGGKLASLPDYITDLFKKHRLNSVEMAFRYLYSYEGIMTILSGMSDFDQIKENIEIFSNLESLSKEEQETIEQARKLIEENSKISCTGCNYCTVCPKDIQIASTFKAYNNAHFYKDALWMLNSVNYEKLAECIFCNKCTKMCPQGLAIPNIIKEIIESR